MYSFYRLPIAVYRFVPHALRSERSMIFQAFMWKENMIAPECFTSPASFRFLFGDWTTW